MKRGKPKGAKNKVLACVGRVGVQKSILNKPSAAASLVCKKPACAGQHSAKECHDKKSKPRQPNRTGGVWLSMDGGRADGRNRIVELREILNNEDNPLKEVSARAIQARHPGLKMVVHDLACQCNFLDDMKVRRVLDRFHAKNHTTERCRTTFNPDTRRNKYWMKKLGITNTSTCEQVFRLMNKQRSTRLMTQPRYRAFWRHWCIFHNAKDTREVAREVRTGR